MSTHRSVRFSQDSKQGGGGLNKTQEELKLRLMNSYELEKKQLDEQERKELDEHLKNVPLSQRKQVLMKFYGEERNKDSPIKERITNKKMIQKMAEEGDVSQFFSDDLLRLYEVMDEFYDEYLDRTKELRPTEEEKESTNCKEESS